MSDVKLETRGRRPLPGNNNGWLSIEPKRIFTPYGAFGETGSGKSYQTKIEINHYLKTIPGVKNGMKVLVFDGNGEYTELPAISLNNIQHFTRVMACRINAKGWTAEQKRQGAHIAIKAFTRGWIIIDDIDKFLHFKSNQDEEFVGRLIGGRHEGVDIMVSHQSLDMGTRDFYRSLPQIRLHKQTSTPSILKSKATECYPILRIAELIIKEQYDLGNIRFFLTIDTRKKKIYGCSKKEAFILACKNYIAENPGDIKRASAELLAKGQVVSGSKNAQTLQAMDYATKKLESFWTDQPFGG